MATLFEAYVTELPLLFEKLKDGGTLGQCVPKSEEEKEEN